MGVGVLLELLLLLLFCARGIDAFVYSCEEVKYRLINSDIVHNSTYAYLIPQEGYSNWNQLSKIYFQHNVNYNMSIKVVTAYGCAYNEHYKYGIAQWKIFADSDLELNCDQEFSLFLVFQRIPDCICLHYSSIQCRK